MLLIMPQFINIMIIIYFRIIIYKTEKFRATLWWFFEDEQKDSLQSILKWYYVFKSQRMLASNSLEKLLPDLSIDTDPSIVFSTCKNP